MLHTDYIAVIVSIAADAKAYAATPGQQPSNEY